MLKASITHVLILVNDLCWLMIHATEMLKASITIANVTCNAFPSEASLLILVNYSFTERSEYGVAGYLPERSES